MPVFIFIFISKGSYIINFARLGLTPCTDCFPGKCSNGRCDCEDGFVGSSCNQSGYFEQVYEHPNHMVNILTARVNLARLNLYVKHCVLLIDISLLHKFLKFQINTSAQQAHTMMY